MDIDAEGSPNSNSANRANGLRKGPSSCAECRRLKIKCDLSKLKKGPCSSCEKRGCGTICPESTLKTGKGTRYILSGTEELHKQVEELRARVKELENALELAHSLNSASEHPLLGPNRFTVPNSLDGSTVTHDVEEPMGPEYDALIIAANGRSQWLGSTAISELFLPPEPNTQGSSFPEPTGIRFDYDGLNKSTSGAIMFANEVVGPPKVAEYRQQILSHLPSHETISYLVSLYYEQIAWHYNPIPKAQLSKIMTPLLSGFEETVTNHELSIVFHILAFGSLMDVRKPADHPETLRYANLARLALSLNCMFADTTVTTIEALLIRNLYILFTKDHFAPMKTWGLQGLLWKLMQSLGMHRDPARWKFSPEECTRRRRVFWEFVTLDSWQCLVWGRPSSLDTRDFDCKMPNIGDPGFYGEEAKYHFWKFCWCRDILLPLLKQTLSIKGSPSLTTVKKLDRLIRESQLPFGDLGLVGDETQSTQSRVYQRNFMFCIKEVCILYLHRPFFVSALHQNQPDALRTPYAGSVLAVHASASSIMGRGPALLAFQPQAVRFFAWWVQGFSAAAVLGALVIRNPGSALAASALAQLDLALKVYEGAKEGFRAAKVLPALTRLNARAHAEMNRYLAGNWVTPTLPVDLSEIPGIVSGVKIITNAVFHPVEPEQHIWPLEASGQVSEVVRQQNVETAVADYLQNLEKELQHIAQNGSISDHSSVLSPNSAVVPEVPLPKAALHNNGLEDLFWPPESLLPSLPGPLLDESFTASFDSAVWASFMGQFGSSPPI